MHAEIKLGDAESLPLENGSFDYVFCVDLPRTRKVLVERREECVGKRVGGIFVEIDHLRREIN